MKGFLKNILMNYKELYVGVQLRLKLKLFFLFDLLRQSIKKKGHQLMNY